MTRIRHAISAVAVMGFALLGLAAPAYAIPEDCTLDKVDHDTYYATCSKQGHWRLRVDCNRGEPDSKSGWKGPGDSASEGCTWGDARSATIETG
jgi:hypothetical protein